MSTPISITVHGVEVGRVWDGVFHKWLRKEHFLKSPPAIACDVGSLRAARKAGAITVEVTDMSSPCRPRRKYWATIDLIERDGVRFNRGHGEQVFLPLDRWDSNDRHQRKLALPPPVRSAAFA